MKILFMTSALNIGGAQRQMILLASGLRAQGHVVLVAIFHPGGELSKDLIAADIPIHCLNKYGPGGYVGFLRRLLALIQQEAPDIVHTYLGFPNFLLACLKPWLGRAKLVWGIRASNIPWEQYGWRAAMDSWLERRLAFAADGIILNSHAGRDHFLALGFPGDRLVVVANGIDGNRFRPDPMGAAHWRQVWGIPLERPLIGMVARIDLMKGHAVLLQAAAILARERPELSWVCVGAGDSKLRQELEAMIMALDLEGRVLLIGDQQEMPAIYSAFDIVTLASLSEGFSNVIGEAMACAIPVVATAVGDTCRIVGETGLVVPPGDPQALADGWRTMLDLAPAERLAMGQAARARILHQFSPERLLEQTLTVLASLVDP